MQGENLSAFSLLDFCLQRRSTEYAIHPTRSLKWYNLFYPFRALQLPSTLCIAWASFTSSEEDTKLGCQVPTLREPWEAGYNSLLPGQSC